MIKINENIKAIRISKGLKQNEVAEKLTISAQGYQAIESGKASVTFERLQELATIFGMSITEVINYPNGEKEYLEGKINEARKQFATLFQITENLDIVKKTIDLASKDQIILDEYYQKIITRQMEMYKEALEGSFQNIEAPFLWKGKFTLAEFVGYQIAIAMEALGLNNRSIK
jgi:transcriptional regulator with XRE-family HTH domain